ncbi:MAG: hypothetical protein ACRENP_20770 [Longimicrobiales bacterium]
MTKIKAMLVLGVVLACSQEPVVTQQQNRLGFFLTSAGPGNGANLGGLEGADRHCTTLADAVNVRNVTWRAYLSLPAAGGRAAVNAKDRIGNGPWYNSKAQLIAQNVADLHSDNAKWTKQTVLNEKGEVVNGRGDTPNRHDVLTGSQADGTAYAGDADTTCGNWTSGADGQGSARVGHFDKVGGGENPTSWNSAHASRGCSQANLQATGGDGLFFCFAIN